MHNFNAYWKDHVDEIEGCDPSNNPVIDCDIDDNKIDRILIELEFWVGCSAHPEVCSEKYLAYQDILSWAWNCVKPFSVCPLKIDSYIGWLNNDNEADDIQAEWIDYHCDRLYMHSYQCNPLYLYGVAQARLNYFGFSGKNPTEVWPLFSAESNCFPHGASYWGAWLGDFLLNGGTMCCAEEEYLMEYNNYASNLNPSWDNEVDGFAWFAYSFMFVNNIERKSLPLIKKISEGITVYPNPAIDFLKIKLERDFFEHSKLVDINVFDINGKLMLRFKNVTSQSDLNISELTNGVYTAEFIVADAIQNSRFVILKDEIK